ncbi:FAD dependent oxidoreductase [Melanomma pulvis-pyrius CBS 109.77]|uniref:FAD dependent oxidoreductase n=1 Tax=Melanomma pulvis-pyrius CBS 109.77 TaxID=1314802 RepID=A0A6A6XS20_9PLEO|nr:FAD dependent oxidoreductase [Melanomma pulvis-pyrius CBS 109.77]
MRQILPVPDPITSYWLSEPHDLSNFRSTPKLPTECDIVIIGSGMAGITVAYHLLQDNESPPHIVIVEARQLCSGATARNGGHAKIKTNTLTSLIPSLGKDIDVLQSYVHGVMDGLKQIVEEEELNCEFELRRSFDVQLVREDSQRLKKIYDESRKAGHKWTKNTAYIEERFVEQVTSIKGATSAFIVPACSFWPYKFVTQLLARLLSRHPDTLNLQTTTPITSVTSTKDGFNLVHTERGIIKTPKVVFATNAYTAGILPQFKDIITPVRGMASHIVPSLPVHPHLSNTYNIDFGLEKGVDYLNPRPDGGIVVGGGKWMFIKDRNSWYNNFDDSVRFPLEVHEYWRSYMQRNFLGWEDSKAEIESTWVGIMGITKDEWPFVGRVPGEKGRWMLAGFNGGGMAMILTAAKAVAKMVRTDCEFEDAAKELGVPVFFRASEDRMKGLRDGR